MIDIQEKQNKVISFLEASGPSLPVQVAKAIEMDPIFASAITSELISSKQVKTSHIKIGASSLYLLPGQEQKLEEYVDNLKPIEKNTFLKLKENKLMIDENEEPAIRVAFRHIRDFAIPFKFQEKIMWKYAFATNKEIEELLHSFKKEKVIQKKLPKNYFIYKFSGRDKNEIYKNIKKLEEKYGDGFVYDRDLKENGESREDIIKHFKKKIKEFSEINPAMKFIVDRTYGTGRLMEMELEEGKKYGFEIIEINNKPSAEITKGRKPEETPKAWKIKKDENKKTSKEVENIFVSSELKDEKPESKFLTEIKNFLKQKNIEFIEEVRTEKKEIMAIINITSQLGSIKFLLIAKNKKTATKDEIEAAIQIATKNKMPCLLIIRKKPSKSIQKLIDENHLIKIETMRAQAKCL